MSSAKNFDEFCDDAEFAVVQVFEHDRLEGEVGGVGLEGHAGVMPASVGIGHLLGLVDLDGVATHKISVIDIGMLRDHNGAVSRARGIRSPNAPAAVGDAAVHGLADDLGHEKALRRLGAAVDLHPFDFAVDARLRIAEEPGGGLQRQQREARAVAVLGLGLHNPEGPCVLGSGRRVAGHRCVGGVICPVKPRGVVLQRPRLLFVDEILGYPRDRRDDCVPVIEFKRPYNDDLVVHREQFRANCVIFLFLFRIAVDVASHAVHVDAQARFVVVAARVEEVGHRAAVAGAEVERVLAFGGG